MGEAFDCVASVFLQGKHVSTHEKFIAETLSDRSMTEVHLLRNHLKSIFSKGTNDKFAPFKIFHEMDFAGGNLSMKALMCCGRLRGCTSMSGILPTASTLTRVAKVVENHADSLMRVTIDWDENLLTFDFEKMLKFIFD